MDAPQVSQRPDNLSRSKSSFSFRSHKSDKSSGSKHKISLTETEGEKRRSKFNQKAIANPNRAINEDQPAVRAQHEQATILPLSSIQHMDLSTGTVITDPDASNPTRSRLERPLDTIRAFAAAADGGRTSRSQPTRTESADATTTFSSRRSSVVGGYTQGYEGQYIANPRYATANGYDAARRPMYGRPSHDYGRGPPNSYQRRGMGQRMTSAPVYNRPPPDQGLYYNNHAYHESYDTVYTGESSQSEPWANSTNPSSENSSIDRIHAIKQMESSGDAYGGQYGQGSNLQGPIVEEGQRDPRIHQGQPYYNGAPSPNPALQMGRGPPGMRYPPPPQPNQQAPPPRPVIPLGGGQSRPGPPAQRNPNGQGAPSNNQREAPNPNAVRRSKLEKKPAEKSKGWLRRRFSKG